MGSFFEKRTGEALYADGMIPWWYGLAWRDCSRDESFFCPIPLNLVVRTALHVYWVATWELREANYRLVIRRLERKVVAQETELATWRKADAWIGKCVDLSEVTDEIEDSASQ